MQIVSLSRLVQLALTQSQWPKHLSKMIKITSNRRLLSTSTSDQSSSPTDDIVCTTKSGILSLQLNRPKTKNALKTSMYNQIVKSFAEAAVDDNIKMVVITGTGDYFSSGNDLKEGLGSGILKTFLAQLEKNPGNFDIQPTDEAIILAKESAQFAEQFVNSFIDFPKPLIAIVNGPAFGIMVTTLALCDNVICSDKAIFSTPFLSTSQVPEGCSTYTFPRIMGTAKANSMLLFNQPLTAQEALDCGLVSKVVPHDQLNDYVESTFYCTKKGLSSIESTITWTKGKPLIRNEEEVQRLKKANHMECKALEDVWSSSDFARAMLKFFNRKK